MKLKSLLISVAVTLASAGSATAAPVYVGSYNVFDGPVWSSNPTVMSGKEAAALLFGGNAADYVISVNAALDPAMITGTAWLDGYGDTKYLLTAQDDDFKLSSRTDGSYGAPPSYSAFVCDHANCKDYGFGMSSGSAGLNYTNYVWRLEAAAEVPEPGSLALVSLALVVLAARRQRRA